MSTALNMAWYIKCQINTGYYSILTTLAFCYLQYTFLLSTSKLSHTWLLSTCTLLSSSFSFKINGILSGGPFLTHLHSGLSLFWCVPLGPYILVPHSSHLQSMQETPVWSLGREDPLAKGMATHFSINAWRTPWTEEPGRLQSTGSQRVRHDWSDLAHTHHVFP